MQVADQLVFVDEGVIVESGNPRDVLSNPKHARTQAFCQSCYKRLAARDETADIAAHAGFRRVNPLRHKPFGRFERRCSVRLLLR